MPDPDHIEQLGFPDLDVAPAEADDEEVETPSGLGKGLSAIIPQLSGLADEPRSRRTGGGIASLIPGLPDAPTDADAGVDGPAPTSASPPEPAPAEVAAATRDAGAVRQLRNDLIRALLDGLANTMRLDLCGYVHTESDAEPELFLRAPALATLGPQRAWTLFAALRDAAARERSDMAFDVAGLRGVLLATGGSRSTGVFVLARFDDLTDRERVVAERFCTSFGRAVHQLAGDRLSGAGSEGLVVEIHEARDSILARVQVEADGVFRPGSGRAATRVEAVTRAVLDAGEVDAVFRYASEVSHGGEHAAVVLLESPSGAVALGSAVTAEPGGRATGHAALRAATALAEAAQPT